MSKNLCTYEEMHFGTFYTHAIDKYMPETFSICTRHGIGSRVPKVAEDHLEVPKENAYDQDLT